MNYHFERDDVVDAIVNSSMNRESNMTLLDMEVESSISKDVTRIKVADKLYGFYDGATKKRLKIMDEPDVIFKADPNKVRLELKMKTPRETPGFNSVVVQM